MLKYHGIILTGVQNMENENKKVKKYLSTSMTTRSVSILLIFSSVVTILAFAVAYNEHRKITVLSQKYDEAMIKINNCEEVLGALVSQMDNTGYSEVTITAEPEEEYVAIVPEITTQTETTTHTYTTTTTYTTTQSKTTTSAAKPSATTTKENIPVTEKTTCQTTTVADKPQKTTATSTTAAPSTSGTYFVTQSGTKYHVGSCSYLSKSKIPITMDRIKAGGYSPCSRCIK